MLLNSLLNPGSGGGGGGGASNLVLTREVTSSGAITVSASTDYLILVNKTVGAATTVNFPAGTSSSGGNLSFAIKDKKGDANLNNITIVPNGSDTIQGQASYVINMAGGAAQFVFSNGDWSVI